MQCENNFSTVRHARLRICTYHSTLKPGSQHRQTPLGKYLPGGAAWTEHKIRKGTKMGTYKITQVKTNVKTRPQNHIRYHPAHRRRP